MNNISFSKNEIPYRIVFCGRLRFSEKCKCLTIEQHVIYKNITDCIQLPKVAISSYQNSSKASTAIGRIINGQPATENQIPHQCAVLSPIGGGFAVCGGSIISTGYVLTGKYENYLHSIYH